MAFWLDIAAFALKALLIVAAVGALAVVIARLMRSGEPKDEEIKVRSLNERYDDMRDALNAALLDKKARKALVKARKKEAKAKAKARTGGDDPAKRLYVLAFKGDMRATAVKRLGHEIDAVLTVARPGTDEVALRLDSPGGTVTGYGLGAAEILRLRERKIAVTALGRSGGGERRLYDGRGRRPHRRRALRGRRLDRRRRAGAEPPSPSEEERDRFRGDDRGRMEALGVGSWRDHARGARAFPRQARRDARGVQGTSSSNAAPTSTSTRSPTATTGSPARRSDLGLVDQLSTGDDYLFRARESARLFEVSTEARKTLVQQILSGVGVAAQKAADFATARLG